MAYLQLKLENPRPQQIEGSRAYAVTPIYEKCVDATPEGARHIRIWDSTAKKFFIGACDNDKNYLWISKKYFGNLIENDYAWCLFNCLHDADRGIWVIGCAWGGSYVGLYIFFFFSIYILFFNLYFSIYILYFSFYRPKTISNISSC